MIRWRRAAVSSSVQSGRMFGSKALTCVPSLTEGVLDSAERGGYRQGPGSVATPLDGAKSTSSPDRRVDAQLVAPERQRADLIGDVVVTKVNPLAAERISSRRR